MQLDIKAATQLLQEIAQFAGKMVNGNRLAARAQQILDGPPGGARVWHLFHVEGDIGNDVDGDRPVSFIVSAESGSQDLAGDLARAAIEDLLPEGATVDTPHFICVCDSDVMVQVGGEPCGSDARHVPVLTRHAMLDHHNSDAAAQPPGMRG